MLDLLITHENTSLHREEFCIEFCKDSLFVKGLFICVQQEPHVGREEFFGNGDEMSLR